MNVALKASSASLYFSAYHARCVGVNVVIIIVMKVFNVVTSLSGQVIVDFGELSISKYLVWIVAAQWYRVNGAPV